MNYKCGLHPRACGLPVYLYGGAGRQRGGVRRIQLSMCKHSSWELRWKWLFSSSEGIFYCPLFLTENRPLKNIGHSLMTLLWPKECFVYAYWQNISVLWHVYTVTRINWKRNTSVLAGTRKCSLESSLDTSLKSTDDQCFSFTANLRHLCRAQVSPFVQTQCTNCRKQPTTLAIKRISKFNWNKLKCT